MNKLFKAGETLIALSDPLNNQCQPRRKGHTYIVQEVSYCSGCGAQLINIGGKSQATSGSFGCKCGNKQNAKGLSWTYSIHFARPKDLDLEIAIAVKQENYELAGELRKVLQLFINFVL